MSEQEIQKAVSDYELALRKWSESQQGQRDGYEYERSFVEFIRESSLSTFELSLGTAPLSKNKKKE